MKKRWWIWPLGTILASILVAPVIWCIIWFLYTDHEARFTEAAWPVLLGYLERAGAPAAGD